MNDLYFSMLKVKEYNNVLKTMNYLFYSKYSPMCDTFIRQLGQKVDQFKMVCIDFPHIRENIIKSKNLKIHTVPCIVFIREENDHYSVQKYEGSELNNFLKATIPKEQENNNQQEYIDPFDMIDSNENNEEDEQFDDDIPIAKKSRAKSIALDMQENRDIDARPKPPPNSGGDAPVPSTTDLTEDIPDISNNRNPSTSRGKAQVKNAASQMELERRQALDREDPRKRMSVGR
jgi:hypothetical protein